MRTKVSRGADWVDDRIYCKVKRGTDREVGKGINTDREEGLKKDGGRGAVAHTMK